MSSEQRNTSNLSTTALYVGVPVLIGAGCYYLYRSNQNRNSQDGSAKGHTDKTKTKHLTPKEQMAQLKQVGNQNFTRRNYDVALDSYTRAIELSKTLTDDSIKPDEVAIFYQNRAACYEALGEYEKVISDCDKALELKKNYVKAYVRRAKAHEHMQNYEKALVDAYSASLLDKFQNQTNMTLTENIIKASSKLKTAEAMKTCKPSWPSSQAIKTYFASFSTDPIKERLGGSANLTPQTLQPLLDEANKPENDNDAFSLIVRGSCQSLMRDMKPASESFEKLLSLDDEHCPARYKANALLKKAAILVNEPAPSNTFEKDMENALELIEQALKIDPENPDIYLHKAQTLSFGEKLDEALELLVKAIELKKDFLIAIAQKFYIEFKLATRDPTTELSKLQGVLAQIKEAAEENPESVDLLQMYAQVLTEMNNFEQADQILIELSKLNPTEANFHVSRALLQFHMKNDSDEVAKLMREALRIDPRLLFAYEILGSMETQRGKLDEGIEIFETAVKYAQTESEFMRCYSLLDSAISQKKATEILGTPV